MYDLTKSTEISKKYIYPSSSKLSVFLPLKLDLFLPKECLDTFLMADCIQLFLRLLLSAEITKFFSQHFGEDPLI